VKALGPSILSASMMQCKAIYLVAQSVSQISHLQVLIIMHRSLTNWCNILLHNLTSLIPAR